MKTRLKKALSLALTALMILMLVQGALATETEVLPTTEDAAAAEEVVVSEAVVPGAANDDFNVQTIAVATYTIVQGGSQTVTVSNMSTRGFNYSSEQSGITASTSGSGSAKGYTISVASSVPAGTYTLTVTYRKSNSSNSYTDTLTIHVTAAGSEQALVYYLKTPTSNPDSNETGEWCSSAIGTGTVNTASATWINNKNIFTPGSYVTGMPSGLTAQGDGSWKLTKQAYPTDFSAIFNAYKTKLQEELKVTLTEDDIEAIYLTPYKISKNNGSTPDKHIDCTISIKTKNVFSAVFWVDFPDGTRKQADAKNYKMTNGTAETIAKTTKAPDGGTYPETMTVDGVEYTFDGWYNENGDKIDDSSWPYAPNETELADGTVNFYAHYTEKQVTLYYVAVTPEMGSVSLAQETLAQKSGEAAGSTAAAKPYHIFAGWYSDPDCTQLLSEEAAYKPAKADTAVWADGTTYYAKFEENKVVINYVPVTSDMGEVSLGSEEVNVLSGEAAGSTPSAKDTYKFVGWFMDEACEVSVPSDWVGEDGKITPQKETLDDGTATGYKAATYYAKFEKDTVSLTVTKKVEGNFGDKSKAFVFSMQVDGGDNSFELTGTGATLEKGTQNNDYIFSLNDGGSIKIEGIPAGKKIALAETNAAEYEVSFNGVISSTRNYVLENGLNADTTVEVKNERNTTPDTGVSLDALPYILIIACVAAIGAFVIIRRRKARED